MIYTNWIKYSTVLSILILMSQTAAQEPKLGDISDGSRTTPIHVIKLMDQDSSIIFTDEHPLMPFSTRYTCNPCHQYKTIQKGLHFSAGDSGSIDGRKSHPWVINDPSTATQIPFSMREWQGTMSPDSLDMDSFDILSTFGRHLAGNTGFEDEKRHSAEKFWRWQVSGTLEINCMICHDAEAGVDAAGYASQMIRQNFRWAPTATVAWANVKGTAKDLPDTYDIYAGIVPDQPQKLPPTVSYQENRFDERNQVFMDLTRKIEPDRCYFCHSVKIFEPKKTERWHYDEDVHLKAGMVCVDCHRHGLDHRMVRGYHGEAEEYDNSMVASLSCEGCHLGSGDERGDVRKGRLGAPYPLHRGIPVVHFEQMSCTACHSGPWPRKEALTVKTSMSHGLGLHNINKSESAMPHLQAPVFARDNKKITPHYLMWPSYWAREDSGKYLPIIQEQAHELIRTVLNHQDSLGTGDWPLLGDSLLVAALDSLQQSGLIPGKAAYLSSGYRFTLNADSQIAVTKIMDEPYLWPLAHDVRPASQSLGINGCTDCHTTDSAVYFGRVDRDSPVMTAATESIGMFRFMEVSPVGAWVFSFSFFFRPVLKFLIFFGVFVILAVLLVGGLNGLTALLKRMSTDTDNLGKS